MFTKLQYKFHWHQCGSSLTGLRLTLCPAPHRHQQLVYSSLIHSVTWASYVHQKKNTPKASRGLGRVPIFFVYPNVIFCCDLKLCTKFHNPRTTPSGRKVCSGEKKRKKNNHKDSGNFFPLQHLAVHALCLEQQYFPQQIFFLGDISSVLRAQVLLHESSLSS